MNVKNLLTPRALVAALFLAMLALPTAVIASAPQSGPLYAPPAQGGSVVYVVQPGDDLFRIALRFGTTIGAIQAANNIANPNLIFVGQQLIIPVPAPAPTITGQPSIVYTVQPGDDLFRLALRFNTTIYAIQVANGIQNPNLIFVGQQLVIPTGTNYATGTPNPYQTPAQAPTLTPTASETPAQAPTLEATPSASPSATTSAAVSLQNTSFQPNVSTVHVGTTVTWTNNDSTQHTVTSGTPGSPSGLFDSGTLNPGQTFSYTFTTPGTFPYYCRIHGAAMTGTVTVIP